jgi:hypothetical protein
MHTDVVKVRQPATVFVSPRKLACIIAASRALPFRLRRKPNRDAGLVANPVTIGDRVGPRHIIDRVIVTRAVKHAAGRVTKRAPLGARNADAGDEELADIDIGSRNLFEDPPRFEAEIGVRGKDMRHFLEARSANEPTGGNPNKRRRGAGERL